MENLKNKFVRTVLLSIVFFTILFALLLTTEHILLLQDVSRDGRFKAESVRRTVDEYYARANDMRDWYYAKIRDTTRMMTYILRSRIVDGEFTGNRIFEDGIVVRIQNGEIENPESLADYLPGVQTEKILTEYEPFRNSNAMDEVILVISGHIGDGWYYLNWTSYDEYMEYVESQLNLTLLIDYMSKAYGGEFLTLPNDSSDGMIQMKTAGLGECKTINDLGITVEDLNKGSFDLNAENKKYRAYVFPNTETRQLTIIYFDQTDDESDTGMHRILTMMGFSFCFLMMILTFCYSVLWSVREKSLSEAELSKYAPGRMKRKTILLCVLSGLLFMSVGFFSSFVQVSHHENQKGFSILNSLEVQLNGLQQNAEAAAQIEVEWYKYFGQKISTELTRTSGLLDKEKLSRIVRFISANLIMVFDEKGNEIACSSDYIGYSLFDEEYAEAAAPFRNLLKGVPSYVRAPEPDFVSGQESYVIGVRYTIPNTEKYGALLIFVDPYLLLQTRVSNSIDTVYNNLVTGEEIIMNVDPETKEILSISNEKLKNDAITDLDFNYSEEHISNELDFFTIGDLIYYGISKQFDGKLYYYGADITETTQKIIGYALSVSIFFTLGCLLLTSYALKGYTRENIDRINLMVKEKSDGMESGAAAINGQDQEKSQYLDVIEKYWKALSPEGKAFKVFQVLSGLVMLILIAAAYFSQNATMAFLVTGNWQKGINPFAAAVIFAVFCVGGLVFVLSDLAFLILFCEIGTRERAVFQIIRSLLKFTLYAAMLYISLDCLGVNTRALVASVGIISVALSLGSKDLVSDILAGLGIVFDGALQVGDFVEISDFKGIVEEIGIRSTKLRDPGSNNYKIINNTDVKNVVNYSKMVSKCRIVLDIPIIVPVDVVDAYLSRELSQMSKDIPEIIGEPVFSISNLGHFYMSVTIVSACEEKNIAIVRKNLLRKLKERLDIILRPYVEKLSELSIKIS